MLVQPLQSTCEKLSKISKTLWELLSISLPTTLTCGCILLLNSINIFFISNKYNDIKMVNAIGASYLYVNCTSFIITFSLVVTMDTLCSAALGAKKIYLMGLYVMRTRLISYTVMIISIIINWFIAIDIIHFLTGDIEVVEYCRVYIFKYYIAILIDISFRINMSYLSIVDKTFVNSVILAVTSLLHLLWCYILIDVFDMGINGIAYAMICTQSLNAFFSFLYIYFFNPYPDVKFFINRDCFRGWLEFIKVALPITSMLVGEWVGYEIQAVFAMQASSFDFSVHIILVSIENVVKSFGIGMSVAAGIRLANSIVSSDIETCKYNLKVWYIFCKVSLTFICLLLYFFRLNIIELYTKETNIIEKLSETFYLLCIYIFLENGRLFIGGVFRGISSIIVPSILQIFFNYVVTIVLSYILALKLDFGVEGLWMSIVFSYLTLYSIFICICYNIDFDFYKRLTLKRIQEDNQIVKNENELENTKIREINLINIYKI